MTSTSAHSVEERRDAGIQCGWHITRWTTALLN